MFIWKLLTAEKLPPTKNPGTQSRSSAERLTNRLYQEEEGISGFKDRREHGTLNQRQFLKKFSNRTCRDSETL